MESEVKSAILACLRGRYNVVSSQEIDGSVDHEGAKGISNRATQIALLLSEERRRFNIKNQKECKDQTDDAD
jgi:5-enolpyruvylshikimate-3-phosphate synthase